MRRSFSLYLLHERCERLFEVAFRRRDVDDHEGFGISTQRVLHHLREMKIKNTTSDYFHYPLIFFIDMINHLIVLSLKWRKIGKSLKLLTTVTKHKESSFTVINVKEKQQILTF